MADTATPQRCPNCTLPFLRPKDAVEPRTARVEELLRQNHPPLDVELSGFRKVAEDARSAIEDLDFKIVQTQELLENLFSARQQAQSRLEDAKSLLHPMRSIPNELLAEIFGCCISEIPTDEDPNALDPRASPWLLASVSRRWRNLAVNLPQLWTYLLLDFDKHKGHISDHQCAYKVCLFTERSRGLPMTVYLGSEDSLKRHPVLPVLEASIPRWRHLEVDLPRSSLRCLSGNNFSMLQTIVLRYHNEEEWYIHVDIFKLARTPVLHKLEVPADEPWCGLKRVALPWCQLSSIVSFPAFDADGLNSLRNMVNLDELSVVATSAHTPIHNVVWLPKLSRLTITESEDAPGRSKEFFSALTIPALLELTLEYHEKSVLHFPASRLPLGNLTKLDITCDMSSHAENTQHILNFLTLTHHVECLRLDDFNMTIEFVDGLNLDKITDGLLPCLQSLDIGRCGLADTVNDINPFFEMLFSRLPAVMADGKNAEEETVDDNASRNAGMDGTGRSAASNETGLAIDPRSRLDAGDHRRCLKTVRFPRWLYVQTRTDWRDIFHELTSMVNLECGVTMSDIFPS